MNNQALYLKWRPQIFEDLIGQEHITTTLRNSLRQERVRHAYLFSGPRGTGKTSMARLLAKAVNCQHEDVNQRPCNQCHNCTAVAEGRFFDLIEIDAASHTGVDDVRDLRDKIAFSPSEGKYKVYIIDEVHRFSGAAFDALLKTLEEPPAHAIFVLATTEIDKVPATIKSRCLMFEFRRVSLREVVEHLQMICDDERISVEPAALELIARQGTGSVRDSISLLDQVVANPDEYITLELVQQMLGAVGSRAVQAVVQAIIESDAALALDYLNQTVDMGADPRQFGQQLVDHLRQIMLVQIGGVEIVDATDEMRTVLAEQAAMIDRRTLIKAVGNFNNALNEVRGSWQPQLPLELAIIESTQVVPETPVIPASPPPQPAARPPKSEHTTSTTPSEAESVPGVIELRELHARWQELVNAPMLRQTTVPALLKHSSPRTVAGNMLTIVISNPILKSKLERDLETLVLALEEIFGVRMGIQIDAQDDGDDKKKLTANIDEDDLTIFGKNELNGEVSAIEE